MRPSCNFVNVYTRASLTHLRNPNQIRLIEYPLKQSYRPVYFSADALYTLQCGPRFIIPPIFSYKRIRNWFRYDTENSPKHIRSYTDIFYSVMKNLLCFFCGVGSRR